MGNFVDNMLEKVLGNVGLQINIVAGAILLVVGIVWLAATKKRSSKAKKAIGWSCVGVGCLGMIGGVVQLLL